MILKPFASRVRNFLAWRLFNLLHVAPFAEPEPTSKAEPSPDHPYETHKGYAADGEDILVFSWLKRLGSDIKAVTYLDVGAAHPWTLSNTFLLYQHGAKGVLVEPDPELAARLKSTRPRDTVLNVGVAFDERRSAELIRMSSRVFNTFSDQQAAQIEVRSKEWDIQQSIQDRVTVDLVPLNDIIAEHFGTTAPDFLSIDAESKDWAILSSLDLTRFRPKIICVEGSSFPHHLTDDLLFPHGYELMAQTPENFIYVVRN